MSFSSNVLSLEVNGQIATLWLDRPEKRNAMSHEMVNDIYADADAVYAAALELAGEIAANAPLAVRGTKFILQQSEELTTEQSLLLNGLWTMVTTLNSNDLKEAMHAFVEKRPSSFTGT